MIIEVMLTIVKILVQVIFGFLGILPDMPNSLITAIDEFMDLIFMGSEIVSLFVPMDTVRILIPIVIAIMNFDKILRLVMFVLKKIPFLGME